MFILCIIAATILTAVSCGGHGANDKWKESNQVQKIYDSMYNNLAHTTEDASNCQKRVYSIVITGILRYMASGGNTSVTIDVSQPADVIASETRTQIDITRSIIDPALNAIKRACPPKASQKACLKALAAEKHKLKEKCEKFPEHFEFFEETVDLFRSEDYVTMICEWTTFIKSCADDVAALKYLNDLVYSKKHKEVLTALVEWYKLYANGDYSCNLPPGACSSQ